MKTTEDLVKHLGKTLSTELPKGTNFLVVVWGKDSSGIGLVEASSNVEAEEIIEAMDGFKEAYLTSKLHSEYRNN